MFLPQSVSQYATHGTAYGRTTSASDKVCNWRNPQVPGSSNAGHWFYVDIKWRSFARTNSIIGPGAAFFSKLPKPQRGENTEHVFCSRSDHLNFAIYDTGSPKKLEMLKLIWTLSTVRHYCNVRRCIRRSEHCCNQPNIQRNR